MPRPVPDLLPRVRACQVCRAIDCFAPHLGYPVDTLTGQRSTLCFKRRATATATSANQGGPAQAVPTLAHLHCSPGSALAQRLAKAAQAPNKQTAQLLVAGFPAPIANATMEQLSQSGHTASATDVSVRSFQALLAGLGFDVPTHVVRATLAEGAGKRPKPPCHDDKIANIAEVQAALLSAPSLRADVQGMLRVRPGC